MTNDCDQEAKALHNTLDFIGLRAQATTVGLLQLCSELVKAGILDDAALQRIKDAIRVEISLSHRKGHNREEFNETLRQRLDSIFPRGETAERTERVGSLEDMQSALDRG
jgi:hypothetical protein